MAEVDQKALMRGPERPALVGSKIPGCQTVQIANREPAVLGRRLRAVFLSENNCIVCQIGLLTT